MKPSFLSRSFAPTRLPQLARCIFGIGSTLALLSSAGPAQAQHNTPVHVQQTAPATLRLRVNNPAQLPSSVQVVWLATGQPLFAEQYVAAAYGHQFSFNHLPSGRYALLLRVGPESYRLTVRVRTRQQQSTATVCELRTRQVSDVLVASVK